MLGNGGRKEDCLAHEQSMVLLQHLQLEKVLKRKGVMGVGLQAVAAWKPIFTCVWVCFMLEKCFLFLPNIPNNLENSLFD